MAINIFVCGARVLCSFVWHACAFLCEPRAPDLQASPQPRVNFTSYGLTHIFSPAAGVFSKFCTFYVLEYYNIIVIEYYNVIILQHYQISYVATAPFCAQRPPENTYFEKTCFWGVLKVALKPL